ncbi:WD40-repeat-containing domain protein [Neurospora tetraspora]|uniref:Probable cytosolic iron-sulfur protein assembly protein 1 n=1 Tax=Neurospora tetraspora TaxID=94610 RepID=A0AAE0MS63_9PEZI|nr:WD40-repeat-containing domain protein [Neurospora tetraspora]
MATETSTPTTPATATTAEITPLPPFSPDLYQRAWASIPHPSLPLIATCHAHSVTVFSLSTLSKHSVLTGGHTRSVRSAAWQPPRGKVSKETKRLRLVTGSFDTTAGVWTWDQGRREERLEREVRMQSGEDNKEEEEEEDEWELTLVLEGHENEVKSVNYSPSGQYLATCSRDKSVWIWEDVGNPNPSSEAKKEEEDEDEDEWETVAVLQEHDGDVKAVAWCPDVPGRKGKYAPPKRYGDDVLASASYDNTVRLWREDGDGEWVCVAVLEGHEGTVWGVAWEGRQREKDKFPRLLSWGADEVVRVWSLKEPEEEEHEEGAAGSGNNPWGFGVPNTMRRSLKEEWECTAVLPKVHKGDIYSVAWSTETGLLASVGSDSVLALYQETANTTTTTTPEKTEEEQTNGDAPTTTTAGGWKVLTTVKSAHGPFEINHITWCKRYDAGSERKGEEEMLVTTGDDGVVRPWQVRIQ